MYRGQEAEGLVGRDAACGDETSECEVPPHVRVAEGLDGEDQHHDRRGGDPCEAACRRAAILRRTRDDQEVGALHWFCAPGFGVAFACRAQTLPGAQSGTGGRCSDASLSVGTNATLRPS